MRLDQDEGNAAIARLVDLLPQLGRHEALDEPTLVATERALPGW